MSTNVSGGPASTRSRPTGTPSASMTASTASGSADAVAGPLRLPLQDDHCVDLVGRQRQQLQLGTGAAEELQQQGVVARRSPRGSRTDGPSGTGRRQLEPVEHRVVDDAVHHQVHPVAASRG